MTAGSGGGLRLEGGSRTSHCGTWFQAATPDGRRRGVLLLDQALVGAPGALDRAVATVTAVRRLNLPGVLRMADLVMNADRVWLITEVPAAPTLAELLAAGGSRLDPTAVALLASDTGETLDRLHQAGVAHGAVGADTVVLTAAGSGSLVEVGLSASLRGGTPDPRADVAAWAAFVRTLAQACPPAGDLLGAVASEADGAGLTAALRTLTTAAQELPDFPSRGGLVAIAQTAHAAPVPSIPGAQPPAPPAESRTLLPAGDRSPVPAQGRPAVPDPVSAQAAQVPPTVAAVATEPADQATRMGKRAARPAAQSGGGSGGAVNLRFGPGVPAPTAEQVWRGTATKRTKRRRTLLRSVLSGLVTLALAAGVAGVFWYRQRNPLVVTAVAVAPAEPPGSRCDITIDVVGTVQTNGRAGTFSYQWVRSDGQTSAVLDQSLPRGAAAVEVHLYWSFSGRGTLPVTATLKILAPSPVEATGAFTYACG